MMSVILLGCQLRHDLETGVLYVHDLVSMSPGSAPAKKVDGGQRSLDSPTLNKVTLSFMLAMASRASRHGRLRQGF